MCSCAMLRRRLDAYLLDVGLCVTTVVEVGRRNVGDILLWQFYVSVKGVTSIHPSHSIPKPANDRAFN